jgi:hypothetical protein
MLTLGAALALMWMGRAATADEVLPVNPDVTPDNVDQTICVSGFSHTVRPPWHVTNEIKRKLLVEAGVPPEQAHDFILDHRIPISSGGSPDDPANLILQSKEEAAEKDRAENRAHSLICTHRLGLRDAQTMIWRDWHKLLPNRLYNFGCNPRITSDCVYPSQRYRDGG